MLRTILIALALLIPAEAFAITVYLNDRNVNGIKNQQFKNCTVKIDEKGNIFLYVKGIAVRKGGTVRPDEMEVANPGAPPTKRYFLVTEKAAPGMSQYDIDMYINNKWTRKLLDDEEHIYLEVTKYLKQGDMKIRFIARKNIKGQRRSQSGGHFFRVVIGKGDMAGREVMMTRKLIDFKVSAMQTDTVSKEFTVRIF